MESQSESVERIRHEREALAQHLNELESIVREEPRRWFFDNLPRFIGGAFGASLLVGFVTANRRTQSVPRRR